MKTEVVVPIIVAIIGLIGTIIESRFRNKAKNKDEESSKQIIIHSLLLGFSILVLIGSFIFLIFILSKEEPAKRNLIGNVLYNKTKKKATDIRVEYINNPGIYAEVYAGTFSLCIIDIPDDGLFRLRFRSNINNNEFEPDLIGFNSLKKQKNNFLIQYEILLPDKLLPDNSYIPHYPNLDSSKTIIEYSHEWKELEAKSSKLGELESILTNRLDKMTGNQKKSFNAARKLRLAMLLPKITTAQEELKESGSISAKLEEDIESIYTEIVKPYQRLITKTKEEL